MQTSANKEVKGHLVFVSLLQGDGNIRYYELSAEKPYLRFLMECRSLLPQKGLGERMDVCGPDILSLAVSNDL